MPDLVPTRVRRALPPQVKDLARSAADRLGQATAAWRTLPTFLIVGAQRCGTTSLFKALMQHPRVRGPVLRKGVHYFDLAHARGLDWYRGHFPLRRPGHGPGGDFGHGSGHDLDRDATDGPGNGGPAVQIGESSPYYLFHPLGAQRIARDLPGVRVLVALRDPVERAYSAHAHELARGFETAPFERALELEPERLAGAEERLTADPTARCHAHQHHAYLTRGRYVDQLERLAAHLGRERIHVVESETFFARPEETFAAVERFLGLPHHDGIRFERHNARPRAHLDASLRARLAESFEPYDARLAAWLGRTPAWRR